MSTPQTQTIDWFMEIFVIICINNSKGAYLLDQMASNTYGV